MSAELKKLNKVFFDGDENIVIQDVENTKITINKNNPKELQYFFDNFKNRISELEEMLQLQHDGYRQLKNLFTEQFPKFQKPVLVVGTGSYNLPETVYQSSVQVGRLLAELDCNLVVGGWEGVDYVVAEEFSKLISQKDVRLSDKLTQVVSDGKQPVFKGGNVENVPNGVMEWIGGLRKAKALILIGGEGGTYETYHYAKQEKIPSIPLPQTGGDALKVYAEILSNLDQHKAISKNKGSFTGLNSDSYLEYLRNILINILDSE